MSTPFFSLNLRQIYSAGHKINKKLIYEKLKQISPIKGGFIFLLAPGIVLLFSLIWLMIDWPALAKFIIHGPNRYELDFCLYKIQIHVTEI